MAGPSFKGPPPSQLTPTSVSEPSIQEQATTSPPTSQNPPRRVIELQLLHHWTVHTQRTFATRRGNPDDEQRKWQSEVVKEAFTHDFLLSAIFAVTAMHISISETTSRSPAEISQYRLLALEYHDDASKKFRANLLGSLTPDSHTAAFVFSVLTMAMSLALTHWSGTHTPDQVTSHTESSVQRIKTFFQMIQGVRSIFNQTYQSLRSGPFHIHGGDPLSARNLTLETACTDLDHDTDVIITSLSAEIESPKLTSGHSSQHQHHKQTYRDTLDLLRRAFAETQADGCADSTMFWAAHLTPDFLDTLEANEPMALLIVLYWAVLLHQLRDIWWIGPSSRTLVSEISHLLLASIKGKEMEDRMLRLVSWPRQQVELGPATPRSQLGENVSTEIS